MRLIGLMAVRNEAYVLGLSARVALMWVDALVIGNHASTDKTGVIIADLVHDFPGRIGLTRQNDPEWDEMRHRQDMLVEARRIGATHIAMIDADEILTGNLIRLNGFGQGAYFLRDGGLETGHMLTLPLYNLRGGIRRYHLNGLWGNRTVSVALKDSWELQWGGDTFHQREPRGGKFQAFSPIAQGEGGVMHLWGANARRLIAKHALYKVTERLRWPDKDVRQIDFMYSQCVKGGLREDPKAWMFADVPEAWWKPYEHLMHYLDVEAEPWQEAEVRRLVAEHGRERFAGLDLFGVA